MLCSEPRSLFHLKRYKYNFVEYHLMLLAAAAAAAAREL